MAEKYIHGYSPEEQERLYRQARFLESKVYETIDFSRSSRLLEVGCGVGAQTEILLERFPDLTIQCLDASPPQVETARRRLAPAIARGRVKIDLGDALHLPYADGSHDAAYLCWFLEHVSDPVAILREIRRVLVPGRSILYCTEVQNSSLHIHPRCTAMLEYWKIFNEQQERLGGDPYVGAKLGNLLLAAGFGKIETVLQMHHYDNRNPARRAAFIDYWTDLLLSGAPGLVEAGLVSAALVDEMKGELGQVRTAPDAVFFYTAVQARAEA